MVCLRESTSSDNHSVFSDKFLSRLVTNVMFGEFAV